MATDPDTLDDLEHETEQDDTLDLTHDDEPVEDEGEPEPQEDGLTVLRKLRAANRQLNREKRELEGRLAPKPAVVGPEPTLDDPQFGYDEDKFRAAHREWVLADEKAKQEQAEAAKPKPDPHWDTAINGYNEEWAKLSAAEPEAQAIIEDVDAAFSPAQLGPLIRAFGRKAPALFVKIGRDPDLMDRLADITDPFALVAEATRLESRDMPRARPDIDTPVRGKPVTNTSADKTLARLEAEAEKTGDRTKLIQFKRKQREKSR